MRRLRVLFLAGALVTFGALIGAWLSRVPPSAPSPAASPSLSAVAPEPSLPPSAPESPPRAASPSGMPGPPAAAASLADAELIALEDKALRRVDVVALLEREGIDPRELSSRPDADDLLRHLAADELLTLWYMRQMFQIRVYPRDYPHEAAMLECRTAAEGAVAGLSPEDRMKYLKAELALPAAPPPQPVYRVTP